MEKRSFSSLISQMADIYKNIQYTKYQSSKSLKQGKVGEYRKSQAHIMYQKRKLYSIKQKIKDILNTKVFEVNYVWGKENKKDIFSGLTQDEVSHYLQTCAMVNGVELKILEIKEIPTFNSDSLL